MADNRLRIDGKEVRIYLCQRYSRVLVSGAIPVDRKERNAIINNTDERRFIVLAQVEAFDKDHCMERLKNELFPMIPRKDWEILEELDPEHDIGVMGSKHPLIPLIVAAPKRVQ